MVHDTRSSTPTSSWTSSTTHKSSRRIPVCCSASVRGCHICMYFWPGHVHSRNHILCSTHQSSPFRIFLSKFVQFLAKECSLIGPLSSRTISTIILLHICRNEIIRFWVVNIFIATWNMPVMVTIRTVVAWSLSGSYTSSPSFASCYFMVRHILLWGFVCRSFWFFLVITPLSHPLMPLPLISCSMSAQVFKSDLLRFTQPLTIVNNWHTTTVC